MSHRSSVSRGCGGVDRPGVLLPDRGTALGGELALHQPLAADAIARLGGEPCWGPIDSGRAIPWVEDKTGKRLFEYKNYRLI